MEQTKEKINDAVDRIKNAASSVVENLSIEDILSKALKVPGVKIDRAKFLGKELICLYPEAVVDKAIKDNPATAGVECDVIDRIAKNVINYETNKVSAISFAAGVPGGFAMIGTVTADVAQYFAFILRVMQKLAYLYGFGEFELSDAAINDGTSNEVFTFLGVMMGVQEANAAMKIIADTASKKVAKDLAKQALTKGTIYPIVKSIAKQIGFKMTKQVFADGVSKIIPVVGGVASGGLTYATFKPCSYRLMNRFKQMPFCNPEYYHSTLENFMEDNKNA